MMDRPKDAVVKELIQAAEKAKTNAYAPYSSFKVGAALLTAGGKIYSGCNVENASYGLTCCAERVALFKAVSEGEKDFIALALVSDSEDYCAPCGACRQVMAEFELQMPIYMGNNSGLYRVQTVSELLPNNFSLKG